MYNTVARTLALLAAAASGAFRNNNKPESNFRATKPQRKHELNPQEIDLFYMGTGYRRRSKYEPHTGKKQIERFARNYGSDENGTIFAVGKRRWAELASLRTVDF